jgi:hypothetical protein
MKKTRCGTISASGLFCLPKTREPPKNPEKQGGKRRKKTNIP